MDMFNIGRGVLRTLLKPKVDFENESEEINGICSHGTAIFSPVQNNMDVTLLNAMRRVLLGFFPGYAITAFQIEGVTYEFESIGHISEDVGQIALNIKQIRLGIKNKSVINEILEIKVKGPCEFRAGMIEEVTSVKVINKDQLICTINSDVTIDFKFLIGFGYNYLDATSLKKFSNKQIGLIYIDALFNPIRKVSFSSEAIVVNSEDCKKAFLTVETDGSIDYRDAIKLAVEILQEQLSIFGVYNSSENNPSRLDRFTEGKDELLIDELESSNGKRYDINLFKTLHELDLPVRAHNAFTKLNMYYMGDLLCTPYKELIIMPNLGKKSLETVDMIIAKFGLCFDYDFGNAKGAWPPPDLLSLRKQYENRAGISCKKKNNDNDWS